MKWILAFLLLVLLTLQFKLWVGEGSYGGVQGLKHEIILQETENEDLELRNELLYREIAELKAGQDAVEELARSELGMIREGEIYYLLVDEEDAEEQEGKDGPAPQIPLRPEAE